ncbi:MAG: hypothetical protein JWM39_606 [Parcubacteria group bacterium]|jgi:hypothetical protein|nr:hypothetical protein [Parcubacteria group bacterium]
MNTILLRIWAYIRRHVLLLLIVLLFVLLVIGYALGYRPGPSFTVVRAGNLTLSGIPAGGVVYADQTKRATSVGKDVRIDLEPGSHNIIVDVPGDNPWNDVISISPRMDTKASPILVPLKGEAVFVTAAQADAANTDITSYVPPSETKPLVMENGNANVYVLNNRIVASPATTTGAVPPSYLCIGGTCATTVVFAPTAPLRAVLPYPGRQDALIVSYGSVLAVIEIDPLKPQFFAPLYTGLQPAAATFDAKHIVVRDAGKTFTIAF